MTQPSSSSCWSRGIALSRTTQKTLCFSPTSHTTRTTASLLSTMRDLTQPQKSSCPGTVLERASPPSLSGCWCPANHSSPWTSRTTTPAPLWTHRPAHHHPAARSKSLSLSPLLTESQRRRDRRAIARGSNRAEDRLGARASSDVRPGARASYSTCHEGEGRGQRERGEKLRPLHHG